MSDSTTPMEPAPRIAEASDHSMLVVFARGPAHDPHESVRRLTTTLQRRSEPFVRSLHPAYASVLVTFDPRAVEPDDVRALLQDCLRDLDAIDLPPSRSIEIPVCYDPEFGPDLQEVASHDGLSVDEVVAIHCGATYRVDFLGFSPGFPYLSGMSPRIAAPRLAVPRTRVPAGSVAIGGTQTGVYPLASPGGWRLIGRTPLRLFRLEASPPALLQMGDTVRFARIDRAAFDRLAAGVPSRGAPSHAVAPHPRRI